MGERGEGFQDATETQGGYMKRDQDTIASLAFGAIIAIIVFLCSSAAHASHGNPLEFKQPMPKVSDAYYAEAIKLEKSGDPDVTLFLAHVRYGWQQQQKREGRDEPADIFIGCQLYQVGGPKALQSIGFAHAVLVIEGQKREDGKGEYTADDAYALRDSWNESQMLVAQKLWLQWQYYAASCYKYTHGGFIVMPEPAAWTTHYAMDRA
jgi:hypothetical protein